MPGKPKRKSWKVWVYPIDVSNGLCLNGWADVFRTRGGYESMKRATLTLDPPPKKPKPKQRRKA